MGFEEEQLCDFGRNPPFVSEHDVTACGKIHILYQGTPPQLAKKRNVLKGHGFSRAVNV
jgi:hypothetical protein